MDRRKLAVILSGCLLGAVVGQLSTTAQDTGTGTSQPAVDTIEIGDYAYDVDSSQSLILVTDRVSDGPEGTVAVPIVLLQLTDGTFTRMTPCDDVAVLCQQVYIAPKGVLRDATAGDSYILGEKVTAGNG